MDQRIRTRVIDTGGAAKSTLVQKNPCEVCWITISVETHGTKGSLKLYDGFDAGGKLRWQIEPATTKHTNFNPTIPCDQGLFIYNDANIACYTVGYRSLGWKAGEE